MTVTSYPNRTAPTIRGKWVLEQLLGTPPPPPPPNVPALKEDARAKVLTMRQRMEEHRASPHCAVCHRIMDPLGFALENFDGIGRWRDTDGDEGTERSIPSGVLPDGTLFNGPGGLREILLSRRDQFVETFTERLLTYALGRGVEEYDRPVIRKITREAAADDHRWSAIILGIVKSKPFQMIDERSKRWLLLGNRFPAALSCAGRVPPWRCPLLDAMTPAFAVDAARPTRMAFIEVPNGIMNWTSELAPKAVGRTSR